MLIVQVRRENAKTWKKCLARASDANADPDDDGWELKPETTFVKNDDNLTVVEPDQLIESHKYGSQLITLQGISVEPLARIHLGK